MSISSLPEMPSLNAMAQSNITSSNNDESTSKQINKKMLKLDPSSSTQAKQQNLDTNTTEQQAQLKMLTESLDKFLSTLDKGISFRLDENSGKQVVTVYEISTGDIIKQYPEEKMLKIAQRLADHVGSFVDEKI